MIKAIETVYKGYRFRSRLEARWAVFFDTLGIPYEYEKEGFDLDGVWYLPDFWLPEQRCWIEIKGQPATAKEIDKAQRLCEASGDCVCIFDTPLVMPSDETRAPMCKSYWRWGPSNEHGLRAYGGWQHCPVCRTFAVVWWGQSNPDTWHCETCDMSDRREEYIATGTWSGYEWHEGDWIAPKPIDVTRSPQLIAAYAAARQARFEHGK